MTCLHILLFQKERKKEISIFFLFYFFYFFHLLLLPPADRLTHFGEPGCEQGAPRGPPLLPGQGCSQTGFQWDRTPGFAPLGIGPLSLDRLLDAGAATAMASSWVSHNFNLEGGGTAPGEQLLGCTAPLHTHTGSNSHTSEKVYIINLLVFI